MRTNIPHIVEGEIYQIQPHFKTVRKPIRYICKLEMPDGSTILVPNCIQSTMFGGIDDYFQTRARASQDSGEDVETSSKDEKNAAQVGDRVYVAFIGGNIQKPVIIGYAQHPNQTYEFEDEEPADIDPSLVFKYLGMKVTIDDKGQMRLIHRGAPTINYKPKDGGALGALGDALAATALGDSGGPGKDKENAAVEPQDPEEITLFEFLEGGIFRIRDAEGQIIEIDRTKKRIYLSNNDLKSTQNPDDPGVSGNEFDSNSTDAEYFMLDKEKKLAIMNARGIAQIYTNDKRKDVTEGKHTHTVGENSEWTIDGDEVTKIKGNQENTIEGNLTDKVKGNIESKSKGTYEAKTEAGGGVKFDGGKVAIGGKAAELLDLFDQTLQQLDSLTTALAVETHPTAVGPSGPPVNAADYAAVKTQLASIKGLLGQIKGTL